MAFQGVKTSTSGNNVLGFTTQGHGALQARAGGVIAALDEIQNLAAEPLALSGAYVLISYTDSVKRSLLIQGLLKARQFLHQYCTNLNPRPATGTWKLLQAGAPSDDNAALPWTARISAVSTSDGRAITVGAWDQDSDTTLGSDLQIFFDAGREPATLDVQFERCLHGFMKLTASAA